MKPTLPLSILSLCAFIIIGSFLLPVPTDNQQASIASAQSTPSVSFTQEEVQGKEGSTIYLKVKLNQPVTKTTKVTIKLTPDQGTTSRDIAGLTATKNVIFYANGLTTKTVAIKTNRTTTEANKGLTATITKVGNVSIPSAQADTIRVTIVDQKSAGTILTGNNQNNNTNNNNNQNNNNTNLPPTNCAQYEGVIPGETRKLTVQQRQFIPLVVNSAYSLSADAKRDLALLQTDLGFPWSFRGEGPANSHRMMIPSGTVLSWKFKTTEYNAPVYYDFATAGHPGTIEGNITVSVSKCPGNFTSPEVLSKCLGVGPSISGTSLQFGIVPGNQYICNLDTNSTYYLNVTAGFPEREMSIDTLVWPHGHTQAAGGVGSNTWTNPLVKNRDAWYSEIQRISSTWYQSLMQYAGCRRGGGTDGSCSGGVLPNPYSFR